MINMNRSTSTDPYASPFMSFAALPLHNTWEPNPNPNSSYNYSSFLPDTPFLDPTPPLMPIASFPFAAADYSVKAEEEQSIGGIGVGRIGLNLGHRTYFSSGDAAAIDRLFARSRGVYALAHQPPRCQAEGCKADLSGAKHYHRRHKVCEFHSKATVVIAGGLQQRFCQQCSRFHVLSEFDEAKRSCRKRLADHNRRRRKPQPQASSDPSAPKNHSTNSSEKIKQPSRTTKVITSSNKPTNLRTSITRGSTSMEGQQGYQNRGSHMRNGPALSLGGVGGMDKGGLGCQNLYQNQVTFVSQQLQQPQQQQSFSSPSASSNTCFHSHNLLCSTSSGGGGSEHQHQQSNANLLHLGQAMFEVDFM